MDLTLNQIIDKVDELHVSFDSLNDHICYPRTKNIINELRDIMLCFQGVNSKISNIYNICNNKHIITRGAYKRTDAKCITNKDWNYNNTNKTINKPLTHDININVKIVSDINEIPNTPIYWVSNINQFAFQINGVILRGNIGNIYDKTKHNKTQLVICKYGNKCQTLFSNNICKFYHDPYDLLKLLESKKISKELFNHYASMYRNFINTSWLYTDSWYKNDTMRPFGSRNLLRYSFDALKLYNANNKRVVENFKHQCMHDILVLMGMNQCDIE